MDITSYVDGVKEVHNPSGQAHAPVVWEYFNVRAPYMYIYFHIVVSSYLLVSSFKLYAIRCTAGWLFCTFAQPTVILQVHVATQLHTSGTLQEHGWS